MPSETYAVLEATRDMGALFGKGGFQTSPPTISERPDQHQRKETRDGQTDGEPPQLHAFNSQEGEGNSPSRMIGLPWWGPLLPVA